MNIEQTLTKQLVDRGLFDHMAAEVMQMVKAAPENKSMSGRWTDEVTDYPPKFMAGLWVITKPHALKWIDTHLPHAWFRPLFDTEST